MVLYIDLASIAFGVYLIHRSLSRIYGGTTLLHVYEPCATCMSGERNPVPDEDRGGAAEKDSDAQDETK